MSAHAPNTCPRCGGKLQSNGGLDSHAGHAALHGGTHGLRHGHPLMLALGAGMALARALFPKKYVCKGCGYSVSA